jgi:hypothetical protein
MVRMLLTGCIWYTYANTRCTDVAKMGRFWLGVDRRGRRSSNGGGL